MTDVSVKRHSVFTTFGEDPGNVREGEVRRDRWPGRLAFYMAAVGSAVGFGNVWRFPALAKEYGGGAFFIPYLLALFIIGLPLLVLEIALGQFYQTGDVGVFGSFHKRFRGVGVSSTACGYMLVVYYSMLLAWVAHAFFASFGTVDPWAKEGTSGENAVDYFTNEIVGMSTLGDDLRPTRIVWPNVGYSALAWFCIFACLAFGLKWTGRITYVTMGLPIVLLFVFLGKAVSLEGSQDGINAYIGEWDMSVLTEQPDVWSTAVSQIFFSLSVTFGVMTAYGSHCPRHEPAFLNSTVIGISNSLFSFISGFAVFAALGHLAYVQDKEVDEVPYKGFSLVFGTWPVVLGTLQGGEHWVRLLFFDLFLLGIDSAFSILEGPLTVAKDSIRFGETRKWKLVGVASLSGWLIGFMYATDAGLIFLDTVDFYINFVMLLVGFFETFAAGWVFGLEEQIASLGPTIVFIYMFTNFGSVILASGLWFGLKDNAVWGGFLGLILSYLVGIGITLCLLKKKIVQEPDRWTWKSIIYEISFRNVMSLKEQLTPVVGFLPTLWAAGMRQLIPQILLVLFINLARSKNDDGDSLFGHYEGYVAWPFQVIGILCVVFAACLFLIGLATPKVYEGLDTTVRGPFKQIHLNATDRFESNDVDNSDDADAKDVEEAVEVKADNEKATAPEEVAVEIPAQ